MGSSTVALLLHLIGTTGLPPTGAIESDGAGEDREGVGMPVEPRVVDDLFGPCRVCSFNDAAHKGPGAAETRFEMDCMPTGPRGTEVWRTGRIGSLFSHIFVWG